MKTFISSFIILLIISISVGCKKNSPRKPEIIYLKHINLAPNTTVINLTSDCSVEILYETLGTFTYGHSVHTRYHYLLKSNNTDKLKVSFERITKKNSLITMAKDQRIDEMTRWIDNYPLLLFDEGGFMGFYTEYVAIRVEDEGKIKYGWLRLPNEKKFCEYAIDTTGNALFIFAGNLEGIW